MNLQNRNRLTDFKNKINMFLDFLMPYITTCNVWLRCNTLPWIDWSPTPCLINRPVWCLGLICHIHIIYNCKPSDIKHPSLYQVYLIYLNYVLCELSQMLSPIDINKLVGDRSRGKKFQGAKPRVILRQYCIQNFE